jgi:hypothetical protein
LIIMLSSEGNGAPRESSGQQTSITRSGDFGDGRLATALTGAHKWVSVFKSDALERAKFKFAFEREFDVSIVAPTSAA